MSGPGCSRGKQFIHHAGVKALPTSRELLSDRSMGMLNQYSMEVEMNWTETKNKMTVAGEKG